MSHSTRTRDEFIEDVDWLTEMSVPPQRWPDRLGMSPAAVSRRLYRYGRRDDARRVERVVAEGRRAAA